MRNLLEFLSHFLRLFVVMLFSVLGASMAFAVPMAASEISFHLTKNTVLAQPTDVGFTARAPPSTASNVAVTGGVTSMQGSAFALHGQEPLRATSPEDDYSQLSDNPDIVYHFDENTGVVKNTGRTIREYLKSQVQLEKEGKCGAGEIIKI